MQIKMKIIEGKKTEKGRIELLQYGRKYYVYVQSEKRNSFESENFEEVKREYNTV